MHWLLRVVSTADCQAKSSGVTDHWQLCTLAALLGALPACFAGAGRTLRRLLASHSGLVSDLARIHSHADLVPLIHCTMSGCKHSRGDVSFALLCCCSERLGVLPFECVLAEILLHEPTEHVTKLLMGECCVYIVMHPFYSCCIDEMSCRL
jgi:hypothetical protein